MRLLRLYFSFVCICACKTDLSANLFCKAERLLTSWRGFNINYEVIGSSGPSVLLIPGFGVGTFHYHRNINFLQAKGFKVWSLDLVGQGQSWPIADARGVCYSVDTWRDQISYFIDNIIMEPVHLAGNSLGGYLSVYTAHANPALVKSVTLMNPTPFWAFFKKNNLSSSPFNLWDGTLPSPKILYDIGSRYFDTLRQPLTVKTMLEAVYTDNNAFDDELVNNIIESASHPLGQEAFTSILFAPKADIEYEDMLRGLTCPVCLVMGKDDPWVVPYWGQRVKRVLPYVPYFELSPTGHCPHHESPNAVNHVLSAWLQVLESEGGQDRAVLGLHPTLQDVLGDYDEQGGRKVTVSRSTGQPRNVIESVGAFLHNVELSGKIQNS